MHLVKHASGIIACESASLLPRVFPLLPKAWRADHMPRRGHMWLGRRPLVHKGFWRSWTAHGVGDRVIKFLAQLLADSKLAPADWRVYITGDVSDVLSCRNILCSDITWMLLLSAVYASEMLVPSAYPSVNSSLSFAVTLAGCLLTG
jgi:hypothetical protein